MLTTLRQWAYNATYIYTIVNLGVLIKDTLDKVHLCVKDAF